MTHSIRFGIAGAILAFAVSFFMFAGSAFALRAETPTFYANVYSGGTPLTVTFTAERTSFTSIDFGDGSTQYSPTYNGCQNDVSCNNSWNPTHTYGAVGEYTARLMNGNSVVGTVTIKVFSGSTSYEYLSVSPSSGNAPLTVTFTAYGVGENTIEYGDGQTGTLSQISSGSSYPVAHSGTHTYSSAGTYTAKVRHVPGPNEGNCAGNDCWLRGTVTVTVTANTGSSLVFSADPTWGYAPLAVNFSASGGSYTAIDYGDGYSESAPLFSPCVVGGVSCNVWRPSHTYSGTGFYQVKLINGTQAVAVTGVNVRAAVTVPPVVVPVPPTTGTCPLIQRRLARGSSGSDVIALQNYFVSIGVLGSSRVTGYFGPLTEGALQEWQESRGIIARGSPSTTGWGATGPLTRSALARCGL